METDAYIALGSNLGTPELNLLRGVAEIGRLPESRVTALSSFYETSPVGNTAQPPFCNAVLRLSTKLDPHILLRLMLQMETEVFKRIRTVEKGPRTLDLDLLLYGTRVICEEGIIVPHPRLQERRFVLQPLCDIAPKLRHPTIDRTVKQLLKSLSTDEKVRKL